MKVTINGKRYDTNKLDICGHQSHYNNGTPSGDSYIGVHADGTVICWTESNGNDIWVSDEVHAADGTDSIDDYKMTDEEEQNAIKHGLIKLA